MAAPAVTATIKVEGYREAARALHQMDRSAEKEVRAALKKAAGPVVEEARGLIGKYQGASTKTIGPKTVQKGVYVTQRARKVTGKRGDFGALQMRKGLIPALNNNAAEIEKDVLDAVDELALRAGFRPF